MSLKSSQENRGLSNTSERPDLNFNTVFQPNLGDQAQPLRVVTPTQDISERSHR